MPGDKFRFRFRKAGTLRLLSHHDLMRCAERMLRRADLPFKSTAGFHPAPRLVFALSLPLGVVGANEVVELELTRELDEAEVLARLRATAPDGLDFTSVRTIPMKHSAVPRRAVYRLTLPPGRDAALRPVVAGVLAAEKLWVAKSHPRPRQVNVRPYIRGIGWATRSASCQFRSGDFGDGNSRSELPTLGLLTLELDLWVTGQGTARAEDLLRRLGLADVLADGAVLERTHLEIHDEAPPGDDRPPDGPPETAPLDHAAADAAGDEDASPTGSATWGLSPSGPVVE